MVMPNKNPAPGKLFVDSGAWLAFFSARDGHHAEADRLMRQAIHRKIPLLTTNLVLAEVHRLLLFRAGIRPAAMALERIGSSSNVSVTFSNAEIHQDAVAWLAKLSDQVISYTDAVSFAVMKASRCPLAFSFDHDFVVAGHRLWRGD
jgi:predicted nucleic acid-binding protein